MKLLIHAGAGNLSRDSDLGQLEPQMLEGLKIALETGYAILRAGGSSLDAVIEVVAGMEDYPLFNAGRGSVLTLDGRGVRGQRPHPSASRQMRNGAISACAFGRFRR